ncbi:hypothetical protein G7046_g3019 [Stylonectria norvegica]|nr:hypothetical protein G7046_g3019 [Stylonectria norvegica]
MGIFAWCSRRAGGLAMLALLGLSYWVISRESTLHKHRYKYEQPGTGATYFSSTSTVGAGIWTFVFAYYCLLVHVLVSLFPVRACWSLWGLTQTFKRSTQSNTLRDLKKLAMRRRSSYASSASSETLTSSHNDYSSTVSEAGDSDPDTYTEGGHLTVDRVIHAIIIPNYKEELDTLKETLDVLASHPQAHDSYDIYLGMEQREDNAESKALLLIQQFSKEFRSIHFTLHPGDIAGEAAGKGSNVAWAARKLSVKYSLGIRKDVIVTGIDADSHLSSNYFTLVTNMHLSYPGTSTTTLYAPPIIFDRNAHNVPACVRVADILWCAGGLSGLYPGSTIAPPTSVYSLPLELVDRVGGWDGHNEAIGEDLHMYIKCFFALNGNLTCRTVNSPVSQTNVTGGSVAGASGLQADLQARYKQALRHMWGALDSGFALRKAWEMWQKRKHTSRACQPLHYTYGENSELNVSDSQLAGDDMEQPYENGIYSNIRRHTMEEPNWELVFYLFHRLFEAHFLPLHMTILMGASTLYLRFTDGNDDPHNLAWAFTVCKILRIVGFLQICCYLFLYESFHRICVATREKEMTRAGIAEGMRFSQRSFKKNWTDYVMLPLCAPLYGAIPLAQAQICHFWTMNLVYTVSKKVTRRVSPSAKVDEVAQAAKFVTD